MTALHFRMLRPFGVELLHDLSKPFNQAQSDAFTHLFAEHGLLLARGQSLTMARQRELCGYLGPILVRAGEGEALTNEAGGPSVSALTWHSDAAYTETPFDALSLHALDVVDDASSTRFISAEATWRDLPQELSDVLAHHDQAMVSPHYSRLAERTFAGPDSDALVRGRRPCVVTNPHNGRACLWTSELQTARLLDMEQAQSDAVLGATFDFAYDPARVLEHRWRKGDFIVWDNIALQHARGNLEGVGRRVLQRVIVGREGVAPHVAAEAEA